MKYAKYELRLKKVKVHDVKKEYRVSSTTEAYDFATRIIHLHELPEERFYVITLDAKGGIIGYSEISKGSLSSAEAHPREVYKTAILQNASSIICFHNHPSGDPEPSQEDIRATKRLDQAGSILGIPLLDHIIIGDCSYNSLKENGLF